MEIILFQAELPRPYNQAQRYATEDRNGARVGEVHGHRAPGKDHPFAKERRVKGINSLIFAHRVLNSSQDMLEEIRFLECFFGMAAAGIEGPPAVEVVVPGNRMVVAVLASFITRFIEPAQDIEAGCDAFVIVPFVCPRPFVGQVAGRGVVFVNHDHGGFLRFGMALKVRAYQLVVPGPVVFRVGGGVDAHKSTPAANVLLECILLSVVQNVAGSAQEYHRLVFRKAVGVEKGSIVGSFNGNVVFLTKFPEGFHARWDGFMVEPFGFVEYKDAVIATVAGLLSVGMPLKCQQAGNSHGDHLEFHGVAI